MINIHSGTIHTARQNTRREGGGSVLSKLGLALNISGIFIIFGILLYCYIKLNQITSETDHKIHTTKREIHNVTREIENLRIQRETLSSWPHIRKSIQLYGLDLRLAEPSQVKKMVLRSPYEMDRIARTIESKKYLSDNELDRTRQLSSNNRTIASVPDEPNYNLSRIRNTQ